MKKTHPTHRIQPTTKAAKQRLTHHLMTAFLGVMFAVEIHAQSSAFTYQGHLTDNGSPASGIYDLRFTIYDLDTGGSVTAGPITNSPTAVSGGLFTVTLDFGAGAFDGSDRWLEIGVATNGSGIITSLVPRQQIVSAPYAIQAANAASAASVNAANITGMLGLAQLPATVVTNDTSGVSISGTFAGDGSGLSQLDSTQLTGPFSILPFGSIVPFGYPINVGHTNNGGLALGVTLSGNYAYLANDTDGLRVYHISNPTNVINVGHIDNGGNAHGVTVSGNYAYLANIDDGLRLYDVSNPTNMINVGHIDDGGLALGVTVSGGYAYLANADDGLRVYDVSNPTNVINVGHIDNGGNAYGVTVSGGYAYLANADDGLRVYDVSNPTNVVNVGHIDNGGTAGLALGVTVSGGYAYLANYDDGLRVYDVSDPTNVVNVGHIDNGGNAYGVAVSGNYAYLANYDDGLRAYDISNPTNVVSVGHIDNGGNAYGVAVSGNYAYLANYDDGLRVYELAPPHAILTGTLTVSNTVSAAAFVGDGSGLVNLHAGNITTGTLADARLSANVALLDRTPQAFTGTNTFAGRVGIGTTNPQQALQVVGQISASGSVSAGGISLPGSFGPNGSNVGTVGNYIAFGHSGVSEDFIGYKNNIFYLKDSPGGGDINDPDLVVGGSVTATAFNPSSDRNLKENFQSISPTDVLAKVAALSIQEWNFKSEAGVRHIGPMAQDFFTAFKLGADDKHIATVDADGVALVAIQGLNQKVERENASLRAENAELKMRLEKIEMLLSHKLHGGAK